MNKEFVKNKASNHSYIIKLEFYDQFYKNNNLLNSKWQTLHKIREDKKLTDKKSLRCNMLFLNNNKMLSSH